MSYFTIEVEETNMELIQCLSKMFDCSNERILEDILFKQLEILRDKIQKICVVEANSPSFETQFM